MIAVEGLSFSYPNAARPVLRDVTFTIEPGDFVLVAGPSGSGKSTLLRCLNGLVPHFHGGSFGGRVVVDGRDTRAHQPRDLADVVGLVFQDPESQMVAETVEDEVAFGLESMRMEPVAARKRIEEVLDLLRLTALRERRVDTLSGGERQRAAIASLLAMCASGGQALLLDEPTSQLDPQAAEELLAVVQRLNDELGLAILIAEHRLERVAQYADRVLFLPGDGSVRALGVREAMASPDFDGLAPPVARLGRALGWSPLPLSVREGRRFVNGMRALPTPVAPNGTGPVAQPSIAASGVRASYADAPALRGVSFAAYPGETMALMGRSGAGKTTLLRALIGLIRPDAGTITVLGDDIAESTTEALAREVAFVPQEPASVLYHDSIEAEIADTIAGARRDGTVDEALAEWELDGLRTAHPWDVSVGERQRVALAAMLAGRPRVILLDEPTRGMDYRTKELLVRNLRRRCEAGCTVLLASHDVELAAQCAGRVLLLADGQVVVEGPAPEVLTETLTFSTQVNKLFGGRFLTPEDVLAARERAP